MFLQHYYQKFIADFLSILLLPIIEAGSLKGIFLKKLLNNVNLVFLMLIVNLTYFFQF